MSDTGRIAEAVAEVGSDAYRTIEALRARAEAAEQQNAEMQIAINDMRVMSGAQEIELLRAENNRLKAQLERMRCPQCDTLRLELGEMRARAEAAEADARRGRFVVDRAQWRRSVDEHDVRRSWLFVQVADHADLSCKAARASALDAAIAALGLEGE